MFVQIVPVHMPDDRSPQRWGYIPQRPVCQSLMVKHFQEMLNQNRQSPWKHRSKGGKIPLRYRPLGQQCPASTRRPCRKLKNRRSEIPEECPILRKKSKVMKTKTLGSLDLRGFNTDEVKVKVTDEAVTVSAQRDHPNASFQVKRSLPLPPDADKSEIVHRFVDGEVIVERHVSLEGIECNNKGFSEGNISDKQVVDSDCKCEDERAKATRNEETGECAVHRDRTVAEDGSERLLSVEKQVSTGRVEQTCETEGSNGKEDAVDSESVAVTPDVILSEVTGVKPEFKVQLDLSDYQPNDIRVRFKHGELVVEAERQIKGDNFCETEKVTRHIHVPENVDESELKSIVRGGVMTIRAPFIPDEKGRTLSSSSYPLMWDL
ncbi:uncharacterized protein LOC124281633 [Haliotis rubra]|uniref:uncharacterized protein LOC124281633 n=1 Tax=Haliotis rubra TaxID=36100 RepID=UPI001EE51366|nr:uncharacterized protein LOC124281633 [Haliotis rubra]